MGVKEIRKLFLVKLRKRGLVALHSSFCHKANGAETETETDTERRRNETHVLFPGSNVNSNHLAGGIVSVLFAHVNNCARPLRAETKTTQNLLNVDVRELLNSFFKSSGDCVYNRPRIGILRC